MRTVGSFLLLAVLVLASLGLQRFLVVCNGPHCRESIEFAHSASRCCEAKAPEPEASCCRACARQDTSRGDLDRVVDAGCGCSDTPLHVENGPLPRAFEGCDPDLACLPLESKPFVEPVEMHNAAMLPPPTGPPRTDRRSELVATTVLRL